MEKSVLLEELNAAKKPVAEYILTNGVKEMEDYRFNMGFLAAIDQIIHYVKTYEEIEGEGIGDIRFGNPEDELITVD